MFYLTNVILYMFKIIKYLMLIIFLFSFGIAKQIYCLEGKSFLFSSQIRLTEQDLQEESITETFLKTFQQILTDFLTHNTDTNKQYYNIVIGAQPTLKNIWWSLIEQRFKNGILTLETLINEILIKNKIKNIKTVYAVGSNQAKNLIIKIFLKNNTNKENKKYNSFSISNTILEELNKDKEFLNILHSNNIESFLKDKVLLNIIYDKQFLKEKSIIHSLSYTRLGLLGFIRLDLIKKEETERNIKDLLNIVNFICNKIEENQYQQFKNKDVLENNPYLDDLIVYDKYGKHKSFCATLKFALKIRKKHFNIAIALHPTNRVHFILYIAGIVLRIGYNRKMSFFLNKKIDHLKQEGKKHEVEYNLDLLKPLGIKQSNISIKPELFYKETTKTIVDNILKEKNINKNIIAIHTGASCISKKWPIEYFIETIKILNNKYNFQIVLIGDKKTIFLNKKIHDIIKNNIIDLTNYFSISQLAVFLSKCKLLISNDSGPVHISVGVNTPVIDIFGRNNPGLSPKRWKALGEKDIMLIKDVGCKKCLAHNCINKFKCLYAIKPEQVIEAVEKILKTKNTKEEK